MALACSMASLCNCLGSVGLGTDRGFWNAPSLHDCSAYNEARRRRRRITNKHIEKGKLLDYSSIN